MGPGKVRMITVCTVQIAELRPTQTPSAKPRPMRCMTWTATAILEIALRSRQSGLILG